jgi:hypothetical protein
MPRIISGTLVASTVATVTLDVAYSYVEVVNVSGSAPIYFNVNLPANPTVAGNDCEVVVGAGGRTTVASPGTGVTTVKLISSGTPTYTVAGRGYDEA